MREYRCCAWRSASATGLVDVAADAAGGAGGQAPSSLGRRAPGAERRTQSTAHRVEPAWDTSNERNHSEQIHGVDSVSSARDALVAPYISASVAAVRRRKRFVRRRSWPWLYDVAPAR